MNAVIIVIISWIVFLLAYRFYSRFLNRKLFKLNDTHVTPAHKFRDDIDYVPTHKSVLFSHHFVTIAGLGPILGPAIAVIWGWLPAFLWIIFGSTLIGAVHDFGALVLSVRHDGRSIGDITKDMIGRRARLLFLFIVFFILALAMGVFTLVISTLISSTYHPEVVVPSGSLMIIAMIIGYLVYKRNVNIGIATVIGIILMIIAVIVGVRFPITGISQTAWIYILLIYAFFASSLPVWLLLQPRDYLNSFQLYFVLGLMYLGIFISHPNVVAPAINTKASDLPSLFPFLFIVVACGAVSGFHSLVSSGTTAKQLNRETQARPIGYGGMILEGLLAVAAVLACTAGFKSIDSWHSHYSGWQKAQGLGPKLDAFIAGAGSFLNGLGIPFGIAKAFIAIVVVGFALTTLDSATRLLRYNIEDIGRSLHIKPLNNRFLASLLAVVAIGYFALMKVGLTLWELFGTTNQLLAGLCFILVGIYLYKHKRPTKYVLLPMVFMLIITIWGMTIKLKEFFINHNWPLFITGGIVFILAIWLVVEGINIVGIKRKHAGC